MAEQSTQIVREAPEIEAYKLGLLQSAKALADQGQTIPPYMVAEMSGLQIKATELAEAGIGGYQPYLQEAGFTLGDAQTAMGGVMTDAKPFQTEASALMTAGAGNIPGQVEAAQTGIAGSTKVGDNCQIGGQVGIVGHIIIGNNVRIQAQSGIGRNIKDNEVIQGSPAFGYNDWSKSYVYFKNLPNLANKINLLEKELKALKTKNE